MRPIDADVLTNYIDNIVPQNGNELGVLFQISNYIKQMSPLDVKPVVHGEWIVYRLEPYLSEEYICSQCNQYSRYKTRFCHYCGADMRGNTDEI